jgi:uncharacterized protein YecE (DUF72 family)
VVRALFLDLRHRRGEQQLLPASGSFDVLYQLPPLWPKNLERLEKFLSAHPSGKAHVIEFREPSWCSEDVFAALESAGVALCLHDMRGSEGPLRFVGREWARRLAAELRHGRDVYAYFNNDRGGHAPPAAGRDPGGSCRIKDW